MQQRQHWYEVTMNGSSDGQQDRLKKMLTHPRQKKEMHIHTTFPNGVTKRDHSLFHMLFTKVVLFLRQTLYIILGGFITYISRSKQKGYEKSVVEQSLQKKTIELDRRILELEQATVIEDNFILMASHELKTPMTTISGHAQLLLRRLSKAPELSPELASIRTSVERINGQAQRLNTLIDEILVLSNLRSGKMQLRTRMCDLVDLSREVVEEQRVLSNRIIELEVPDKPVILEADCERLSQVLLNLLDNAHKYSPIKARVTVTVEQSNAGVLFRVADTGPGISKEQQTHIFEAFYRAPEVQESTNKGLGLGLTICSEIVERHRGKIWCESTLNKGSTFFVMLPFSQEK